MAPPEANTYMVESSNGSSATDAHEPKAAILQKRGLDDKELARVMAKNDTWSYPASEDGWVKAHDAVRLDMKDLNEAFDAVVQRLGQGEAVAPWIVANLQTYWPKFEELVHHHHDNEEKIVAPELKKIGCLMPARMSTEHCDLLKALAELGVLVKALKAGRPVSEDLPVWTELRDKFVTMRRDMEQHLLEEEEMCLPILRKEVSQKQFKPIEKMIIASAGPDLMGWFLRPFPTDAARKAWMGDIAGIPGPVQSLIMMPSYKKYKTQYAHLVEEIKEGERIIPEPTGCFAC